MCPAPAQPLLYPIFPSDPTKSFAASLCVGLALVFHVASKLISIAILNSAISPGLWLLFECVVLFAVRVAFGNYRWYQRSLNTIPFAIFAHCIYYLVMLIAPMMFFRHPFFFSPSVSGLKLSFCSSDSRSEVAM